MSGCAPNREHWSGRVGFILAAVGSAVGPTRKRFVSILFQFYSKSFVGIEASRYLN